MEKFSSAASFRGAQRMKDDMREFEGLANQGKHIINYLGVTKAPEKINGCSLELLIMIKRLSFQKAKKPADISFLNFGSGMKTYPLIPIVSLEQLFF
jgi:hypothetical protein